MNDEKKHRVLIVDDESMNIEALRLILNPEYNIYSADNGRSAIEIAEKHQVDIILLDILMPEMDGYTVISNLKSSKKTQDIPVIFITGLDSGWAEERGLQLGAADYIAKPFSSENVRLRVKNQLETLDQLRSSRQIGMTDQLTGLFNRNSFETMLHDMGDALQEKTPASLFFIDVDNFKNYNDNYGYPQGELALKALGKTISQAVKDLDNMAARWSGQEFAIFLSNTNKKTALEIGQKIHLDTENMIIPSVGGLGEKITVSIGIDTMEHASSNMDNLIAGADKALHTAKERGRNQVCHAGIE